MKNIPKKIDKNKDGSYMYPDRKSWHKALTKYANSNDMDADTLIKDVTKKDNMKYKDFMKKIK